MQIGEDIHALPPVLKASRIYIINSEPLTLIDTGLPPSYELFEQRLREIGREVRDIGLILHTHGHVDHIGNTARIKEVSGAKVIGHKADENYFTGTYCYKGLNRIPSLMERLGSLILRFNYPGLDSYLGEVELLDGLKFIHTPGHTAGSVCYYYDRDGGILFSGDTILQRGGKINRSPRRFFSENPEQQEESVKMLLEMGFNTLLTGHRGMLLENASETLKRFN